MVWQTGSEVLPAFVDSHATLTAEPNRPVLGEEYLPRAVELTAQGFGSTGVLQRALQLQYVARLLGFFRWSWVLLNPRPTNMRPIVLSSRSCLGTLLPTGALASDHFSQSGSLEVLIPGMKTAYSLHLCWHTAPERVLCVPSCGPSAPADIAEKICQCCNEEESAGTTYHALCVVNTRYFAFPSSRVLVRLRDELRRGGTTKTRQ